MALEGEAKITVVWEQVRSRILSAIEFSSAWWGYYPSAEDRLEYSRELPVTSIAGNSAGLALDAALWFFHRFQWNDPNRTVLQNDQQELLTRNLR
jgi:hypothetical protein